MSIKVTVIGGGVIGAGWVARFSEMGHAVNVYDPDPHAQDKVDAVRHNAHNAYTRLTGIKTRMKGEVCFFSDLASAVKKAELVIEAVPERIDIKRAVYQDIEKNVSHRTLITSSTSGIKPTDLQKDMIHPKRFLVAHPFNPVYLLPVLEIVGGQKTSQENLKKAHDYFSCVGMSTIQINKEIEAFVADRLMEALWREALWLVHDDIATTQDIDTIICKGFGLRWAQMGVFETFRVAGGEAGMRHFMQQFGPCLKWPWTKLMDVPHFDDALVDKISTQSDKQSGNFDIRHLEAIRDNNLVAIMTSLRANQWGVAPEIDKSIKGILHSDKLDDFHLPLQSYNYIPPANSLEDAIISESEIIDCFVKATHYCQDKLIAYISPNKENNNSLILTNSTVNIHLFQQKQQNLDVFTDVKVADAQSLMLKHSLLTEQGDCLAIMECRLVYWDTTKNEMQDIQSKFMENLASKQ